MNYHDVLTHIPRNERRILLRDEAKRRKSGKWGDWETIPLPNGSPGNGWAREFNKVHRNKVFCILERTLDGGVVHFAVTSLSYSRPGWWEMQRIKNELAGEEKTAVEVYPPQSGVVDGADMFHIWVLPTGLPFGLS